MPNTVPIPLSPSARRAQAAATIGAATQLPALVCLTVADALDGVCAAVLHTAGLDDDTSRVVLGELWMLTPLTDPRNGEFRVVDELPPGAVPVIVRGYNDGPCPCECNSGGRCGGCGHAGCGGRR